MAYIKKPNYPSLKKPGVYPDGSIKELGLDSDNLEKFSLGNWNSIVKNNRKFFTSNIDVMDMENGEILGRPIIISSFEPLGFSMDNLCYFQQLVIYKNASKVGAYHVTRPWPGYYRTTQGIQNNDYGNVYSLTPNQDPDGSGYANYTWEGDLTGAMNSRMSQLQEILDNNNAYIQPNNTSATTNEELLQTPVNFKFKSEVQAQIDEILNDRYEFRNLGTDDYDDGFLPDSVKEEWGQDSGYAYLSMQLMIEPPLQHFDGTPLVTETGGTTTWTPTDFLAEAGHGGGEYGGVRMHAYDTQLTNFFMTHVTTRNNDNVYSSVIENAYVADAVISPSYESLGHPNYIVSFPLSDENITPDIIPNPVDFTVYATISNETSENNITNDTGSFLFYDINDDRYNDTSYPIEVNLSIGLNGHEDFTNSADISDDPDVLETRQANLINLFFSEGQEQVDLLNEELSNSVEVTDAVYYYKVIQWGDEKSLLTDDIILNTEYFKVYDFEDYPPGENYHFKRFKRNSSFIQTDFLPIKLDGNLTGTSHVYNKPGVKSIKIIIFRFTKDLTILNETILVTKNIVINDGALLSQDFSIFGGTDFNFLPLSNKEAIIGGLDEDSKYNNSVEKIKKDDNFIEDDYLERASSREFIDNFNKKLYGESPGQLDLSTTRMYNKPLDIYDFITNDKQSIVDNNFNINTLPINSSATDIFISNEDCIVDLNPQDIEYLSIQNKTGTADKTVLIGDYKVNQPKDGRVQKQGVMQTPLLDDTQDKQAF